MNYKATLLKCFSAAAAVAVGYGLTLVATPFWAHRVTPHPFQIELSINKNEGRTQKHVGEMVTAVNSAGSMMTRMHNPNVPIALAIRSVTTPDGRQIELNDADRIKSTTYISDSQHLARAVQRTGAVSTCVGDKNPRRLLREERIFGLPAQVVQLEKPATRVTEWVIPSIGCVTAKYIIEEPQSDGHYAEVTVGEAKTVHLGEPTANLFVMPAEYAEVAPSAFAEHLRKSLADNSAVTPRERKMWAKKDAAYYRQRNQGGKHD
jgi:hypothetical protein